MDRLDIGLFPKARVDACFKAFIKDKLKGCGNFVFAFFDELNGDAINAMGFFGIKFINDAYDFRGVDDDATKCAASAGPPRRPRTGAPRTLSFSKGVQ